MKKYFLFAAVAGMLASCSSESLTGSDPNIEPTPTQEERVPILLSVSTPSINVSRGTTRGTGTVGGVGVANTDATNVWYGQKINAFMFTKDENHATTLNLAVVDATIPSPVAYYDNAVMITPGTTENLIPGQSTATNIGEAMLADGTILYYPSSGNFDFFGYHGAGVTSNLTKTSDPWTVDFTIDGSNDLMSTKAAPQAWSALTTDQKAKFADETAYNTFINGSGTLKGDFYSAKAARKLIQPVLSFNHLLSRLSFVVKAGDDNAGGFSGGVQDPDKAVHVKSIEVYSKTTGKMAVAWTADPGANMITWTGTGTPAWLALQERPHAYENADPTNFISKAVYNKLPLYYKNSDKSVLISPTEWAALPAVDPGAGADWQGNYTQLIATNCTEIGDNTNYNLIALTPIYPTMTTTGVYPETPVGEALIVAPSTEAYQMKVKVSQKVPTNWSTPTVLSEKEQTYELLIPLPKDDPATSEVNEGVFQANTSYKVVLTVYGFERIEVKTEITPWIQGQTLNVGQDE